MNQLDFNYPEAITLRDEGLRQVADNNPHFLKVARRIARRIARLHGTVTCDQVRAECPLDPLHHNCWGALFSHEDFEYTGLQPRSALRQ